MQPDPLDADALARHPLLGELHVDFAPRVVRIIQRLEAAGYQPKIGPGSAWRDATAQQKQVAAQQSRVNFSYHMETDEFGGPAALAVDLVDRRYPWERSSASQMRFWRALEVEANREGLITGMGWTDPWDPAHVQPWPTTSPMLERVAALDWTPSADDFPRPMLG